MTHEDHEVSYEYPPTPKAMPATPKRQPAKRVAWVQLKMVRESKGSILFPRRQVKSAEDAVELAGPLLTDCDREKFLVIVLDTKHYPNILEIVSVGSLDATIVHPREVFKTAMVGNGSAVLCLHSHPSGDPTPSPEDLAVTNRLKEAASILGIDLLDHLVVGSDGRYTSLRAKGLL